MLKIILSVEELPNEGISMSCKGDGSPEKTTVAEAFIGALLKTKVGSIVDGGVEGLFADADNIKTMIDAISSLQKEGEKKEADNE